MYTIKRQRSTDNSSHWQVDFSRRRQRYAHRFYDSMYGGSAAALQAAAAWRDGMLAYVEALGMVELRQARLGSKASGMAGVRFITPKKQPAGVWQATVSLAGGKLRRQQFSMRVHGDGKAFQLAVAARKEMLRKAG